MKKLLSLIVVLIVILAIGQAYRLFPPLDLGKYFNSQKSTTTPAPKYINAAPEKSLAEDETVITRVIANALPSVVTVGIVTTTQTPGSIQIDPFNPFGGITQIPGQKQQINQNIGSGFIVTADGFIITNKHVVADEQAGYKVLTNDKKEYKVVNIYRDPLNDLAIIKIEATGLKPLPLGDSSKLKLGQTTIAIGTPLGEFTNTVTTGIVSGLGRGITAGSPFEGFVEKLDNVIQTSAPISPGNSGGPLLNSSGQVIGINTAIAQQGQNIGFAIPVNVIKELLDNFQKNGNSFERPYLGVRYKIIDKQTAILNDVVEGAYVVEVVDGSPAQKAGLQNEDIITEFDGHKITGSDDQGLAKLILQKHVGDTVKVKYWRNGTIKETNITLEAYK
ncbi:trypsin-like peptidase domain-containing protein [Patescibacteria group bacterium]|nr:trypsin-like peptidase domain-containing protein [Patescibacteria group bacterium]MCL5091803.1 trypsin-like peptidase domain-containing protein [Patescibacteria group bacterium]